MFLFELSGNFKDLFGPDTNPVIMGQVHPPNCPGRIDEKLRRPRDVVPAFSLALMNQVVTTDNFSTRIRKKRKRITRLLHQAARSLRRIDADRHRKNSLCFEILQILLDTPKLGVA